LPSPKRSRRLRAGDQIRQKQEHFARRSPIGQAPTTAPSQPPAEYEAFAAADASALLANHLLVAGSVEQCREQTGDPRTRIDVLICTFHTRSLIPIFASAHGVVLRAR
jgi:hypothetical protein